MLTDERTDEGGSWHQHSVDNINNWWCQHANWREDRRGRQVWVQGNVRVSSTNSYPSEGRRLLLCTRREFLCVLVGRPDKMYLLLWNHDNLVLSVRINGSLESWLVTRHDKLCRVLIVGLSLWTAGNRFSPKPWSVVETSGNIVIKNDLAHTQAD